MSDAANIRLRFVYCDDVVSEGISWFEDDFWATHVETVMPDGTLLGAHLSGGVRARTTGYDRSNLKREEFVDLEVTQEQADKYHAFMLSQVGKPYDVEAIAGIVLRKNWRDPSRWICSELVAAGFCECGRFPDHLAVQMQHITPRDVCLIVSSMVRA